ncbi:MAG: PCRF domain-containing protein, partial [Chloroflexi bacterium]|nr:PCRF domain-containing protein [Chloroflexota bacterium]
MFDKFAAMEQRYLEIERLMADPLVATDAARLMALGKERASLEPTVATYRTYRGTVRELQEAKALLQETQDPAMADLAKEEIDALQSRQSVLQEELQIALLSKDPNDARNAFVEIRAAAGGEEAALFAAELYRMY